ncbi:MAG: hypothetical protein H7834_12175, partial [Magnetococcus sp. YQC-9]
MGHVRGIVLQKAQNNPASLGLRAAHFSQKTLLFEERANGLKSKAKPWERNLPYMVRPALQGKIFTESTREKLHPYIRPM